MSNADTRTAQLGALLDVLGRHGREGERPEDLLVDFGLVSDREVAVEIALRTGLPFRGLRGYRPDPALFTYVPVSTAIELRVCPLRLEGDVLQIASAWADPDLASVSERFPKLEFDIAIAPREEILDAVAHSAGDS